MRFGVPWVRIPPCPPKNTSNALFILEIEMSKFASSIRFQAKKGQENAFMEANLKLDIADYAGCLSHQCINAGNGRFQSVAVWESEDAIVQAIPLLIKYPRYAHTNARRNFS